MKKIILLAAAGLVSLAACNRAKVMPGEGKSIQVKASIGIASKVTTDGTISSFEQGDKISFFAWTGNKAAVPAAKVVDGVSVAYNGGVWVPASAMLWADMVTPHYFLGVYPEKTVTSFTADPYTLDPANYETSDLLIAVNDKGLKATDNPVSLVFDHVMAKLFVNLTFRNQWETAPTVTSVTVTAKSSATVDYLAAAPVTASGSAAPVSLNKDENAKWSGLQVPQTGVNTITIRIDNKDYVFTHSTDIPLEGGQFTTVNLIVGRNKIELASDIAISGWKAGTTIDNGEAQTDEN